MPVWDLKTMVMMRDRDATAPALEAGKVGGSQVALMPGKEVTL